MNVFVLDNYDSFTFNLVQYLGSLDAIVDVERNDAVAIADIAARGPDAVVISPGPGVPSDAGVSCELVSWCAASATPLLGVCLGHQAIAEAFGARVVHAPSLMHGKTSLVHHDGAGVFAQVPEPFEAMRYHSLAVDRTSMSDELEVTAWTEDRVVMGLRHAHHVIEGVQFHPESVLTVGGMQLLANFLSMAGATRRR